MTNKPYKLQQLIHAATLIEEHMGRVIGINPEDIERYKELHANPWPDIIERLKAVSTASTSLIPVKKIDASITELCDLITLNGIF